MKNNTVKLIVSLILLGVLSGCSIVDSLTDYYIGDYDQLLNTLL